MKTMWSAWSKVLLVSWLGVLGACPAMASENPAPPAEAQTETQPTHIELLRMGQTDDSFEGMLMELPSGQIIYAQSGKGAAALAQYRKMVDSIAPPELRMQFVVPRGVPQADPGPRPTLPYAWGDESAWVRFAVHLTSDYLAMEWKLSEYLKEPVNTITEPRITPGGLSSQYSSVGHYDVADDEAIVLTVPRGDAPYLGFQLGTPWYPRTGKSRVSLALSSRASRSGRSGLWNTS